MFSVGQIIYLNVQEIFPTSLVEDLGYETKGIIIDICPNEKYPLKIILKRVRFDDFKEVSFAYTEVINPEIRPIEDIW